MKGFSRTMPPAPTHPWTLGAVGVLALLGLALLWLIYLAPGLLVIVIAFGVLNAVFNGRENRRLARLAMQRPGESICTFARSFDRRAVDPWVIRATWEEVQSYVRTRTADFPLRASDRLDDELRILNDDEEVGAILETIAYRARRSRQDLASNPRFGHLETVGDVVHLVNHQPRLPDASSLS